MNDESIDRYLSGSELYGDDFSEEKIKEWFSEEMEGYADLGAKDEKKYEYPYHAQNMRYGYRYIESRGEFDVLSIGGAYGDELLPIANKLRRIAILEPSKQLRREQIADKTIEYFHPNDSGALDFEDSSFNLITCYGVLHHIPNISFVLNEIFRVLSKGGVFLLREPIVSMGDWTKRRGNLTKNERGIPLELFSNMIGEAGFDVVQQTLCYSKPFDRMYSKFFMGGKSPYNSELYVALDAVLARLLLWNYRYHAEGWFQKIRPVGAFFVLTK